MPKGLLKKIRQKKIFYRSVVSVFFGIFLAIFLVWKFSAEATAPLLANYILGTLPTDSASIEKLAKYNLLIISAEQGVVRRSVIESIRAKNPQIILLAYVPSESTNDSWQSYPANTLYGDFRVADDWWLKSSSGNKISDWPGLNNTNMSTGWCDYMISYVNTKILSQGIWDGIFWDMVYDGISSKNHGDIDLNGDGVKDERAWMDAEWQKRIAYLLKSSRERLPVKYILMNGSSVTNFQEHANGRMYETFPTPWEAGGSWSGIMMGLKRNIAKNAKPQLYVFNANTNNTGRQNDYKKMRFGLASSLMMDNVYFNFDYGDKDHNQVWWYDEYDVSLGNAVGEARSNSGVAQFQSDVWMRDYSAGLAVVNPTDSAQTVNLGADYERLIGVQDPITNNGMISDRVNLPARDGLLLRKVTQKVENMPFVNGSFVRFFDMKGARKRNGYFVYEDGLPTGAKIFRGDLDGNAGAEKIIASDYLLSIYNSADGVWYNDSPFNDVNKKVDFAIGRMGSVEDKKILFTTRNGGGILLSTYYGAVDMEPVFPLGKKYRAGFSGALGDVDNDGVGEIILGTGKGAVAEVLILDSRNFKIKKRFFPYDRRNVAGIAVAVGDMNGDGKKEIITAVKSGLNILVRVYNNVGKKLSEFSGGSMLGGSTIYLSVSDIDNDLRDEIMVGSN